MARIYINLPVKNLEKAVAFYTALWFRQNLDFTDENASAMNWDETLTVMLLTHWFIKNYIGSRQIADAHTSTEVLNALEFESREAVDAFFEKAITAGWEKTVETYDYGFMYGRDFADVDGHIWEVFWMDVSQMPKG